MSKQAHATEPSFNIVALHTILAAARSELLTAADQPGQPAITNIFNKQQQKQSTKKEINFNQFIYRSTQKGPNKISLTNIHCGGALSAQSKIKMK